MSRVLIVTSGITSIVNANLGVAKRLTRIGHEVCYACDEDIRQQVESEKLPYRSLDGPDKTAGAAQSSGRWLARWPRRPATWTRAQLDQRFGLGKFDAVIAEYQPDLVLIDAELHRYIFCCVGAGVRTALTTVFVSPWHIPGVPPMHIDVAPGQAADDAWRRYNVKRRVRQRLNQLQSAGHDAVSMHRALARSRGFDFDRYIDFGQWLLPFFYRHLPVLNLNAGEFDYDTAEIPGAQYVGPVIDEGRVRADSADSTAHLRLDEGRPLVFCASGQFKASYDLGSIDRLVEVARLRPQWDFVIVTGGVDVAGIEGVPENVALVGQASQLHWLAQADAAVIHGGIMSISECVLTGTPMLMHSLGIRDQDGSVARAAHHGLGVAGSRSEDTAGGISTTLEALMTDPAYTRNLAKMDEHFRAYEDAKTLESAVDDLLKP